MKDIEQIVESEQNKMLKSVLVGSTLMIGSFVLRKGFEVGYKVIKGRNAPKNPEDKHSNWAKALIWAMATGALLGMSKTIMKPAVNTKVNKVLTP